MKTVLMVGAHPDDVELGAAGLVVRLKRAGWKAHYVIFAGAGYPRIGELLFELRQTCELMGAEMLLHHLPNMRLPDNSHRVRDLLVDLGKRLSPDLVLIPSLNDTHQDHLTVAREAVRAFRHKETVLSYEIHRLGGYYFRPNVWVDIGDVLQVKLRVLAIYRTQFHRSYFNEDAFKALAMMRGAQVGVKYAEGFEVVKMFWGKNDQTHCPIFCLECCTVHHRAYHGASPVRG